MYLIQEPFNKSMRAIEGLGIKAGIERSCEIYTGFNQLAVEVGIFDYGGGNATPSWIAIEDTMGCFPICIQVRDTEKEFEIDLHDGVTFRVNGDGEARGLAAAFRFIAETLEIKTGRKTHISPSIAKYIKHKKFNPEGL